MGIFMPHSNEMMVAMLGVLKAGGAWLPLDVLNPKDRLRSIIDSSEVAMLLTWRACASVSRRPMHEWFVWIRNGR